MIKIIIYFVLLFIAIYCLMPTLYYLLIKKPPFFFDKNDKKVMLSFDDGPDPRYTDDLLDILKKNNVKAAFFVVAQKAAENPDIIRRMIDEGHLVGLHSLEHKDAWLESPVYQKRDFESGLAIMENLGCKISFYRAPWGHLNLTSLLLAKKYNLKIVLWTVMVQDWEKHSTSKRVLERLTKQTKNASIICIHDSGCGKAAAEGAPAQTVDAVAHFLPMMLTKGYEFVLPEKGIL
ncbi:MAG: polysaccharide deacetylase family protein [Bacillota bacterium]|nr:polysaccharide deacetylase family protein [Bacillota bacterium]